MSSQKSERSPSTYDIFLSFTGADRRFAGSLRDEMRRQGLAVFIDEMIDEFASIDATIGSALNRSKMFVAVYSLEYSVRPACQRELIAAFTAAQFAGSPAERILVINTEADYNHIQPIDLADAKYALQPDDERALRVLVRQIKARAAAFGEPLGDSSRTMPPWFGTLPGTHGFVGRIAEMWALHNALWRSKYTLAHTSERGPVAAVCGLPGSGKSSFVAAYAWRFGGAYPGGIFWHRAGAEPHARDSEYVSSAYAGAVASGLNPMETTSGRAVLADIGRQLGRRRLPVLWVIDDVEGAVTAEQLAAAVPPGWQYVHTVLIGRENSFAYVLPVVELGPLPNGDALELLTGHPSAAAATTAGRLVRRLGAHAGAVHAAALDLSSAAGLIDLEHYETAVAEQKVRPGAAVHPTIAKLDAAQRTVLRIATQGGLNPVPASLVAEVLADPWRAVAVLESLHRRMVARPTGGWWTLDPLVVAECAALEEGNDPTANESTSPAQELAAAALRLAARPDVPFDVLSGLRTLAKTLTKRKDLPSAQVSDLLVLGAAVGSGRTAEP